MRSTQGTQGIAQFRRVVSMWEAILLLQPSANPIVNIITRLDRESVDNYKFDVQKDDLVAYQANTSTSYSNSATSIVLGAGEAGYFQAGDLAYVPETDEIIFVGASDGSTTISSLTRGFGDSTAAAISSGAQVLNIGDSNLDGADVGSGVSTVVTTDFNYTQIYRTPWEIDGTLAAQKLYGGSDMDYQARKRAIEHQRKMELSCLLGTRSNTTSGASGRRTTGGIHEHLTQHVLDVSGNLTSLELMSLIRDVTRFGDSDHRVMIASREVLDAIGLLAGGLEYVPGDKTIGIAANRFQSANGVLDIVPHPILSDNDFLKQRGYIIDFTQYGWRFLQGRDTMLRTNVQNPGVDGRKDEYLTEGGVWRGRQETSGLLKGVTLPV